MAHLLQVRRPARPKTPARPAYGRRQTGDERRMKKKRSRPVSRVLSGTIIPLGAASPRRSSNLPGRRVGHALCLSARPSLFGLAPDGVFRAVAVASDAVRSYRTFSPLPDPGFIRAIGGSFSVALSVASRLPGVTWRPALRSPDFPPLSSDSRGANFCLDGDQTQQQRSFGRLQARFYASGASRSPEIFSAIS